MAQRDFKASARVRTPSGIVVTYSSGKADTAANAAAELLAKLKLVVGTVVGHISVSYVDDGITPVLHAASQFEDLTLVLSKLGGDGDYLVKTVEIENASLAYKLAGNTNKADITATDISDFATAYQAPDGTTGYAAVEGSYHE